MQDLLVQYGVNAWLGRFQSISELEKRDSVVDVEVVIETDRGFEVGRILCRPAPKEMKSTGRIAAIADLCILRRCLHSKYFAERVLKAANELIQTNQLPLILIDAETTHHAFFPAERHLDDRMVILHVIRFDDCDLDPILESLSAQFHVPIRVLDLTHRQSQPTSCGSDCGNGNCGDCGTTSGGCSSGSCSRDSVKSAEDLSAYFANLRSQMEAQSSRMPLE